MRLSDVPGPRLWAVDGAYWAFRWLADPGGALVAMRERFGPRYRLPTTTPGWALVLADASTVRDLVAADSRAFDEPGIGREAIGALLGADSLFLKAGQEHRRARQLLGPAVVGKGLDTLAETIRRTALYWTSRASNAGTVELLPAMREVSLDVMLHALLDPIADDDVAHCRDVVRAPLDDAPSRLLYLPALQRSFVPAWRRFEALRSARDAFFLSRVRAAKPSVDGGILARLRERRQHESDALLRDHVVTLLVAGHETTAMVAACALDALARTPGVAGALRDELGVGSVVERIVGETPLLDAVCKEALRLFPVATEAVRTIGESGVTIGDVDLEPGTHVFVAIPAVHADATLYPAPREFRPARFLDRTFAPYEYLPFGFGHRLCLGWALATFELRILIATIVTTFELAPAAARPPRLHRYNLGMGPDTAVPVRLTRR